jgi:hypothetical protein
MKEKKENDKQISSSFQNYSIHDLFNEGKCLDIVAAALLLTGKLKVDSVEIFRGSPIISVTLLGKYLTCDKKKTNALLEFLEEHGDMTLDEVFEAFQKRIEKEQAND